MSSNDDLREYVNVNEIFTHVHLNRYNPPPFVDSKYYKKGVLIDT